jgi:hypothetical protein
VTIDAHVTTKHPVKPAYNKLLASNHFFGLTLVSLKPTSVSYPDNLSSKNGSISPTHRDHGIVASIVSKEGTRRHTQQNAIHTMEKISDSLMNANLRMGYLPSQSFGTVSSLADNATEP